MKIICNYNDPLNPPEGCPDKFDYGLTLGKEYLVMGMVLYKDSNILYFLIDEDGSPSCFPFLLFSIKDNSIPDNWCILLNPKEENRYTFENHIYYICGFKELSNDENYYFELVLREKEAMTIYFQRKMELEKYYEDLEYLR